MADVQTVSPDRQRVRDMVRLIESGATYGQSSYNDSWPIETSTLHGQTGTPLPTPRVSQSGGGDAHVGFLSPIRGISTSLGESAASRIAVDMTLGTTENLHTPAAVSAEQLERIAYYRSRVLPVFESDEIDDVDFCRQGTYDSDFDLDCLAEDDYCRGRSLEASKAPETWDRAGFLARVPSFELVPRYRSTLQSPRVTEKSKVDKKTGRSSSKTKEKSEKKDKSSKRSKTDKATTPRLVKTDAHSEKIKPTTDTFKEQVAFSSDSTIRLIENCPVPDDSTLRRNTSGRSLSAASTTMRPFPRQLDTFERVTLNSEVNKSKKGLRGIGGKLKRAVNNNATQHSRQPPLQKLKAAQ